MKQAILTCLLPAGLLFACNKTKSDLSTISLTASTTELAVGQTLTVTANTGTNALSWTVTPASAVQKTYEITTEKTNYFTFSQPGNYVIGVRARELKLDSVHLCNHADSIGHYLQDSNWNHQVDSMWHKHGNHLGGCKNGIDSASIQITVN